MSDNDLPPDRSQNGYLAAKLARLERMLEEQAHMLAEQGARLRGVEQRLGIEPAAPTRPFGQGRAPEREAQLHEQRAAAPPTLHSVTDDATAQTTSATAPPSVTAPAADEHAATHASETVSEPATTPDWRAVDYRQAQRENSARAEQENATRGAGAPTPAAAAVSKAWGDVESLVGGRWFNWLGIIAVIVGTSFFLKYAFERQWIGPFGRVMLGGVAGCAILALAERLRLRGYQAYAYVLSGGGIVILYLSVYAAFGFYHLIAQPVAFALMALVTATAVVLSARYDAYPIAVLGLVGGFMTPALLATDVDNEVGLFGYVALLDAGVLALAYFKRWRSLNYLAFAATWVTFAGWAVKFYADPKLWPTLLFLTLFFVMFAALAVIHNILKQRPARWFDVSLVLTNATLYFATSYLLIETYRFLSAGAAKFWQGPHALLLAAFFVLLFLIARQKHPADRLLTYTYVAAAVTFLTMAVAIQTDQQWVTIGWAVEALMLTWVGLRADEDAPRFAALPVFAVAVMHWFLVDMQAFGYQPLYQPGVVFHPLLNRRVVSCAVLVAVCAGVVWLYRRHAARVDEHDRDVLTTLFVLVGNALAVTLLTVELNDYFSQRIAQAGGSQPDAVAVLANTHQCALSVLWTLYAAAAFVVGLRLGRAAVRYGALALLAAVGVKLLTEDARYYAAAWHAPLVNQTAAAFALFILALWLVAYLYARAGSALQAEAARVVPVVTVAGNFFALVALSLEASGYFAQRRAGLAVVAQLRDLQLAQQLALSVLWALYGAVMLLVGLARRTRLLRLMALALLGVTTAKVFLFDLSSLDKVYRIISFIVLGAILLAVSFLYQQRHERAAKAEGS